MKTFGTKEFYMQYCLDNRESNITYEEYKAMVEKFFGAIGKQIVLGNRYNLPKFLGHVLVKEIKAKQAPINWVLTKQNYAKGIKEIVRYVNIKDTRHCCGWAKNKKLFRQVFLYKFFLNKQIKKSLSESINAGVKYTKQ